MYAAAYLDDIIIHSTDWDSHISRVEAVLMSLREAGLTANPAKCRLELEEAAYLGHTVGRGWVKPQENKVDSTVTWPQPATKKQEQPNRVQWNRLATAAFQDLRAALGEEPVLITPNFQKPFVLQTDVSEQEVAGVEGGHVSVPCHYNEPSSMKKWCRIEGSCVEVNPGKSGRSEMTDDRSKKVFTVTKTTTATVTTYTIKSPTQSHNKTLITTTEGAFNDGKTSPPEQGSQLCSGGQTCLERTLWVLRHAGLVLVFLICTAVAFWKIWRNRRVLQSRENRRCGTKLRCQNNTDADGVYTVSEVVVQRGRSVTIPCLYDREYESHVKYWCHGADWYVCETVVRTDSPKVTGETSITDDPTHHVFTVTMRKLQMKDSGHYWCAVEIQGARDKKAYLYLSVTAGPPGLWVEQQEVAGVEGGHVSVPCHYNEPRSMKMWCRIGGSCVEVNPGKSGRSEIKDDRSKKVFTVTVRELNMEDTGWYWCIAGELQIPVHLTVTQKTTTATVTTSATSSKPSTSNHSTVSTPLSPVPATTTFTYNIRLQTLKMK
ncbi:uncharacterized protein LOC133121425 [Conger conger]|uniref:uncharacterized protein LOC133121425 n=1 Tax=Conger conger TaxID=82655 RepID=UPI002A5A8618|nr:uncharacterized protein LOC133121425 [Conger conger]